MADIDRDTLEAMAQANADVNIVYELRDSIEACSDEQLKVIAGISDDDDEIARMVDIIEGNQAESREEACQFLGVDPLKFAG